VHQVRCTAYNAADKTYQLEAEITSWQFPTPRRFCTTVHFKRQIVSALLKARRRVPAAAWALFAGLADAVVSTRTGGYRDLAHWCRGHVWKANRRTVRSVQQLLDFVVVSARGSDARVAEPAQIFLQSLFAVLQ
jgi:hypothetical protein